MRTTDDTLCREVMLWQSGLMDEFPPGVEHPIIACAVDGAGWAILMHDISQALSFREKPLSQADNQACLEAVATIHARTVKKPHGSRERATRPCDSSR